MTVAGHATKRGVTTTLNGADDLLLCGSSAQANATFGTELL
jgi:hypothetical protein